MSALRDQLLEQLSRFDEEAFVALANRGLYRRAVKDVEKQTGIETADTGQTVTLTVGEHSISFDARGPAHAQCSCPASGVCQHIIAAALSLQAQAIAQAAAAPAGEVPDTEVDLLAPLGDALLAMSTQVLTKHAGKAGYRWAWQFVADLDPLTPLSIGGANHLVLSFSRPRISFRYMGGGVENLVADVDITHIEKYRVAAVLAFKQAYGQVIAAPQTSAKAQSAELDLGKDHALSDAQADSSQDSRERLCTSIAQLLGECLELGLSHLSRGIQERFSTLAVWAQGAEYYRLALLLRRIADHVDLLLERAGAADEHVLLDELTLAYGLVAALQAASAQGKSPVHLVGRARTNYEATTTLELLGLGASAWGTGSGYVGLTMLFWSPSDQCFYTCSDARPEGQRGFNPIKRYKAAGPWSGLGAPEMATGRRLMLTNAQTNSFGRLSAAESASVTAMPEMSPDVFAAALPTQSSWPALAQIRLDQQRSLLAQPQAIKDWVVLKPQRFGAARFDTVRQTLVWPLYDGQENCLNAELKFSEFTSHAIGRIEQLRTAQLPQGTLVVARLQVSGGTLCVEPLSLVCPGTSVHQPAVDALHFTAASEQGLVSKWLDKLRSPKLAATADSRTALPPLPAALREVRHAVRRQAERGMSGELAQRWLTDLAAVSERASHVGFTALANSGAAPNGATEATYRANYICLQYERLIVGVDSD